MSATISDFGGARRKKRAKAPDDGLFVCPDCGLKKFMATITIQRVRSTENPGDVVGYTGARCINCGWLMS